MKSTNKKNTENNNNNISLNESDEENRDDNFSDEDQDKNQQKMTTHLYIHITLITRLIKKTNGEYPCICNNLSKEDCIKNKIDMNTINNINFSVIKDNFNNNLSIIDNNISNINEQNILIPKNTQINQKNTDNINNINNNISQNNNININNNINNINNIQNTNANTFLEEEIVPNLEIQMTNDGKIFMKNIINKLKYLGYPTVGALFSIYIKTAEDYVYIGSDPIDPNLYIDESLVDFENLKIKIVSYLEDKLVKKTEKQLIDKKEINKNQKDKRTKERKIEFIVEKVNAWRRLYNGFYNENGEYTRYSLDQAAKMVGISKKSLDDYLLQLRLGRKYGFNFNQNKTKKVGILRAFVKRHRANNQNNQNNQNSINNSKNQNDIDNEKDNEEGEGDNEQQCSNDSDDSGD